MLNKDKWERERRLLHCRLYKGNNDNEYEEFQNKCITPPELIGGRKMEKTSEEIKGILSIFYYAEKIWINDKNETCKNKYSISEYTNEVGIDFEKNDETPVDLKILLYQIFMESVDGVFHRFNTIYETNLFKDFYKKYYQPLEITLNIRCKDRKPVLIAKCKYYKGEEENPWKDCKQCNLKSIPVARLAIALYVDDMVGKWCPNDDLDEMVSLYIQGVQNLSKAFYTTY